MCHKLCHFIWDIWWFHRSKDFEAMKAGKSAIQPRLSCQYSENMLMDLPSSVVFPNIHLGVKKFYCYLKYSFVQLCMPFKFFVKFHIFWEDHKILSTLNTEKNFVTFSEFMNFTIGLVLTKDFKNGPQVSYYVLFNHCAAPIWVQNQVYYGEDLRFITSKHKKLGQQSFFQNVWKTFKFQLFWKQVFTSTVYSPGFVLDLAQKYPITIVSGP